MAGFSVAIDGPGGAGKSTVARLLAHELGFIYVDTGAMYRAVALHCIRNGIPFASEPITAALNDVRIAIRYENGVQRIFLCDEDVSEAIRASEVSDGSSKVAVFLAVREKLVALQRELAAGADVVMDGRDIGTHVLPDADVKIYLDAGVAQRARRRVAELRANGVAADLEQTMAEVAERDFRDSNREFSPLRRAADAILVDSSEMSLDEVKGVLLGMIAQARGKRMGDEVS